MMIAWFPWVGRPPPVNRLGRRIAMDESLRGSGWQSDCYNRMTLNPIKWVYLKQGKSRPPRYLPAKLPRRKRVALNDAARRSGLDLLGLARGLRRRPGRLLRRSQLFQLREETSERIVLIVTRHALW